MINTIVMYICKMYILGGKGNYGRIKTCHGCHSNYCTDFLHKYVCIYSVHVYYVRCTYTSIGNSKTYHSLSLKHIHCYLYGEFIYMYMYMYVHVHAVHVCAFAICTYTCTN